MFKQAQSRNGLDACRRFPRIIDSGLHPRREELRSEAQLMHAKRMKDLESVAPSIADFDAKNKECKDAGGTSFDQDDEMSSDVLAMLPTKLREDHPSTAARKDTCIEFRDMVLAQTSTILFNRCRGGDAHHVACTGAASHDVNQEESNDNSDGDSFPMNVSITSD